MIGSRSPVPLLLAAVLLLGLAFAPHAAGSIYWANDKGTTIGTANIDGTGVNQNFITAGPNPCGVAVDGAHIYWANGDDGTIGRANLDGSRADQGFITGGNRPCGVAVDGGHIYWANGDDGTIGRANLDGTGANQGFINGATAPCGVAVDVPPPAASPAPPSNVFTLGKPKLNQRRGTAQLPVTVPAPGELALSGGGLAAAKAVRVAAGRAQTAVLLVIRARGAKLRKLVRTGRVAVKPTITYTTDGGVLNTRSTKIALIRR